MANKQTLLEVPSETSNEEEVEIFLKNWENGVIAKDLLPISASSLLGYSKQDFEDIGIAKKYAVALYNKLHETKKRKLNDHKPNNGEGIHLHDPILSLR
jgi:hypothetical protein